MADPSEQRERITLAILALGGQGGGVLADWILDIANANGFIAQGTSVPGVAQRTGSTVYYIEMVRRGSENGNQPGPVLALMPVPGDVDIVIASELMEAGRAILRGFVTADRTTLIGSTHRIYAISEKAALGDGRASSARILDAAEQRAARFIGFDMDAAASEARSLISSVMLGAVAGSGTLPFSRDQFEAAIRHGGKAVDANLRGFAAGHDGTRTTRPLPIHAVTVPEPTSARGQAIRARILKTLPEPAQDIATIGAARLMDYQDAHYAGHYLDRLERIRDVDDEREGWALTVVTARHLALWMSYEDMIRVADLKVRATRSRRVEQEVGLGKSQLLAVTEYMHPRVKELCETLPARLGDAILASPTACRLLGLLFRGGRHVRTTGLRWHLALQALAGLRRMRRWTLRYKEEQHRIEAWLDQVIHAARSDRKAAAELAECQSLIKGYGETFEQSLARFDAILKASNELIETDDHASKIRALRAAALAGNDGSPK